MVSIAYQFLSKIEKFFLKMTLSFAATNFGNKFTAVLTLNVFFDPLRQSFNQFQFLTLTFHFDKFCFKSCLEQTENVTFPIYFISLTIFEE